MFKFLERRVPLVSLALLLVLIQYPLWFGRGGWLDVWQLQNRLAVQKDFNTKLKQRNFILEAQVLDLKKGYSALEELARSELGMIKKGELFFQITRDNRVFLFKEK